MNKKWFKHWYRGVFHSQIRWTVLNPQKILEFLLDFGEFFLNFLNFFFLGGGGGVRGFFKWTNPRKFRWEGAVTATWTNSSWFGATLPSFSTCVCFWNYWPTKWVRSSFSSSWLPPETGSFRLNNKFVSTAKDSIRMNSIRSNRRLKACDCISSR